MNKNILYKIGLSLFSLLLLASCNDNDDDFGNKIYFDQLNASKPVTEILFRSDIVSNEQVLKTYMARAEKFDVVIKYGADKSKVSTYNEAYYTHASLLDSKYYSIENKNDTITAGAVESKGINLTFTNLNLLDTDSLYVLPVAIEKSNVASLSGRNLKYFLFKGASLIDVVVSTDKNYFVGSNPLPKPSALNGLTQLTMEGLIYAKSFDDTEKSFISTFMGIEGSFLLRFGDAGLSNDQFQIATSNGNFPSSKDASTVVPTGKWFHLAITFDGNDDGKVQIFIDGKLKASSNIRNLKSVNLGVGGLNGFQISRSYDDKRYLNGMMSELRIWNVVRSADEIASNFYTVSPTSPGLVAYWKCSDGAGNSIKDFTANGNNLSAPKEVTWVKQTLPAK